MLLQGAIFDLDGTLADTLPVCFSAFKETLYKITGKEYTDEMIYKTFGPSEEGIVQKMFPDKWEEYLEMLLETYERHHKDLISPFPGIIDVLEWLKQNNIEMALVSAKGPRSAAISLKKLNLYRYFNIIKTGSPQGSIKAHCIKEVLNQWNISPKQVIYVGDAPSDVTYSLEAGVIPIGVAWATHKRASELEALGAYKVFTEVTDFKSWLMTLEREKSVYKPVKSSGANCSRN
jgi:HAD superfamily hydrolase (TIGR01549 family)